MTVPTATLYCSAAPSRVDTAGMENFLFGGGAAAAAIMILNPVDVVKSRMQFQGELGGKAAYSGIIDAMMKIGKKEGLQGLYRGLAPALCFQICGNSFRFGVYHYGKAYFGVENEKQLSPTASFQMSLIAGAAGGVAACPFFAIKTSMQVIPPPPPPPPALHHQHHHLPLGGDPEPPGLVVQFPHARYCRAPSKLHCLRLLLEAF